VNRFNIFDVIIGENYLPDHLSPYEIPLCKQIVSNFAIFELCEEFKFLTPLIIDTTGIFKRLIKKKYQKEKIKIIIEANTTGEKTIHNIC